MIPRVDDTDGPLICTIGDLILDVVVLPRSPLVPDGDTPATIRLTAGGQAANVAAWARALGARARLICARGSDQATALATRDLQRRGVEIQGPIVDARGGVVVSTREPDGARTMASDPGVAHRLSPADVHPDWIAEADVLHVSGYCLLREPQAQAAIAAARHARRVTLDLASAHDIELFGVRRFAQLTRQLAPSLVFATEAERDTMPDLAATWVVKLGARGALFPEGHREAEPTTAIETTGAGDALAAGYLIGGPALAVTAAARCVAAVGAMPLAPEAPGRPAEGDDAPEEG
jgi:sugar/nucleoside kinase (ribokinase family)